MGSVFTRVLLVGTLIMGVLFAGRRIWSSGGGFDGRGIGRVTAASVSLALISPCSS